VSWLDCLEYKTKLWITWHYIYLTYFFISIYSRLCRAEYFNLTNIKMMTKNVLCFQFSLIYLTKPPFSNKTTTNPCTIPVSSITAGCCHLTGFLSILSFEITYLSESFDKSGEANLILNGYMANFFLKPKFWISWDLGISDFFPISFIANQILNTRFCNDFRAQ